MVKLRIIVQRPRYFYNKGIMLITAFFVVSVIWTNLSIYKLCSGNPDTFSLKMELLTLHVIVLFCCNKHFGKQ